MELSFAIIPWAGFICGAYLAEVVTFQHRAATPSCVPADRQLTGQELTNTTAPVNAEWRCWCPGKMCSQWVTCRLSTRCGECHGASVWRSSDIANLTYPQYILHYYTATRSSGSKSRITYGISHRKVYRGVSYPHSADGRWNWTR